MRCLLLLFLLSSCASDDENSDSRVRRRLAGSAAIIPTEDNHLAENGELVKRYPKRVKNDRPYVIQNVPTQIDRHRLRGLVEDDPSCEHAYALCDFSCVGADPDECDSCFLNSKW